MRLSPLEREQLAANRHVWDCWAPLHLTSKFYSVEDFIAGGSSLRSIETSELGDVLDKRLLHLQCHFGLDTLSWARLGADAVGVDNSEVAIDIARRLSVEPAFKPNSCAATSTPFPDRSIATRSTLFSPATGY